MITGRLGRTDLDVTWLGLGCVEIDTISDESPGHLAIDGNAKLLNAVLDTGINVIDTAECYGNSEEQIGAAIGARRDEYYLFSKCGHASGLNLPDWSARLLRRSVERSLRRLRTDHIDVLFLHSCAPDVLRGREFLPVLADARQSGKVRYLGYSGDGDAALQAIGSGLFDVLETSVNIVDQEALTTVLPAAKRRGMGVVAKRPIANAVWNFTSIPDSAYLHSYWHRFKELDYEFGEFGIGDRVETALRFTMGIAGIDTAIVGTGRLEHWYENLRIVARGALPARSWEYFRRHWTSVASGKDWGGER